MVSETREIVRRALIAALGALLLIPAFLGALLLLDSGDRSLGWIVLGCVLAAFLVGRVVINWVFLK
jgi:predicted lysophospholipase L1 biosynthesis ABC-type transport system permease subunit